MSEPMKRFIEGEKPPDYELLGSVPIIDKSRNGREVDFIVQRPGYPRILVQVCESMAEPQTRKREVAALCEAMAELQLTEGIIVTRSEDEVIQTESGQITVVPIWRFLLNDLFVTLE